MKDKELKNIKISANAHAKVTELRNEMLGASRERIMEVAVDMLYDLVQREGVGAVFQKTASAGEGIMHTPKKADHRAGFSAPSSVINPRAQGVGAGELKSFGKGLI